MTDSTRAGYNWRCVVAIFITLLITTGCQRPEENGIEDESATEANVVRPSAVDRDALSIANAKHALSVGNHAALQQLVRQALIQWPDDPQWLELAGDTSLLEGDAKQAIAFFQSAVDQSESPTLELLDKLGRTWMLASRPFESLAVLRIAVKRFPDEPSMRTKLAGLLASLGMQREAETHLIWLVQRGYNGSAELVVLSDLTRTQTDKQMCTTVLRRCPDDVRPLFSLACIDAYHGRWDEVRQKTKTVIDAYPDHLQANAYYGRALVELDDNESLHAWWQSLPAGIEELPEYWIAAGLYAEKGNDFGKAARAYLKASQLDSNNTESLNRLAACLTELGIESELRIQLTGRIGLIARLRKAVDAFTSRQRNSQKGTVSIAKLMESLGRYWEAAAWLRAGSVMSQDVDPQLVEAYHQLHSKMTGKTPWQLPEYVFVDRVDLSQFPNVDWQPRVRATGITKNVSRSNRIHFDDEADLRNLRHVCKINKPEGEEANLWIYQSVACGAATLDFDLNGWPDLYLTAMDGKPHRTDSSPNRLFRNNSGQYADVTAQSECGDKGFAQGLAVGDFDMDGFPDLLVANIGQNRLYRNNGDGTFQDITSTSGLDGRDWTTSIATADIDQDGYLDIFEVGYCAGREAFTQTCTRDGHTRSCSPLSFSGQADRVWQGKDDGTFVEVTKDWLSQHDPSCGLGIVIGRFDESPGIDVYVANDMAPNHFWSSQKAPDGSLRLGEQAAVRGLAVDARSLAQASMGITVADPDADGDMDFFLTHHANESNTLYEQVSPGVWVDRSERNGIVAPSIHMLGFGTKWLDADNDGTLELMVVNGHVDDFAHLGEAFRMPMQLFERQSGGVWSLMNAEKLGECFSKKRIARNLINLDANRDGFVDAVVTHLFDPVSILINRSETQSQSITLFLKGTTGDADAIGAKVTIEVEGHSRCSQLIAGDGFQCSSERCVRLGLGDSLKAENVVVEWPSGDREVIGTLMGGHEYLVVEGDGMAFQLH
ncbi:FG-GAP-like repeat-containing protein [Novipirellula herctigrandis]